MNASRTEKHYTSLVDAAVELSCSVADVRKMIKAGKLSSREVNGETKILILSIEACLGKVTIET